MTADTTPGTEPTPEAAAAMTVNERLHAAGLLDDFDVAAMARDEAKLRTLLTAIHLSEPNVKTVIHKILG